MSVNLPTIYCLNFNNPERKASMESRFKEIGIDDYVMSPGVPLSDKRITVTCEHTKKCHSCMYGHLDMIRNFLDNDSHPYGIFCEDDIMIDADFVNRINHVISDFEKQDLDIMLLGYLINHVIVGDSPSFEGTIYKYYEYVPKTIWGTQMYMMTRKHARYIVNKYGQQKMENLNIPFSADWTITQEGNKRIVYPMLAIEDGKTTYEHPGQAHFHQLSHSVHLNSSNYV
jgi:GR25 family glycosyltransferase involved in LPS biosynthesis